MWFCLNFGWIFDLINIAELRYGEHIILIRPWLENKYIIRQEINEWLDIEKINHFIIWQHPPKIVFYKIEDLVLFRFRWG